MNRPTNIKQVAGEAGVSVATVSRVLQTPEVVAPATRERVLSAIQKLRYAPNAQARNLRLEHSKLIVAIVPDIANNFFSEVIRGVERVAQQHGYSVLLGDTEYDAQREHAYARLLSTRQADGLITFVPFAVPSDQKTPLPIVNACEYSDDPAVNSVFVDNIRGASEATAYLVSQGHTEIAFIGGRSSPISTDRLTGYEQAMSTAGLPLNERLICKGDFSAESGFHAAMRLLASGECFTAAFCISDEMALGAISAFHANGLRVPEDVSVVGFDDIHLSRYFDPPLTTVAQPKLDLGQEAMGMLIEILHDPGMPARKRILPTRLVIRDTVRPPLNGRHA